MLLPANPLQGQRGSAPYLLTLLGPGKGATPYHDEAIGRAAWLAAVRSARCATARLVRVHGPAEDCIRCEWTHEGAFLDRTAEHGEEIAALCELLTAEAPPGYRATTCTDRAGRFVVFHGVSGAAASFSCSGVDRFSRQRLTTSWTRFAPVRTYSVRASLEDSALAANLTLDAAFQVHDDLRGNAVVVDDWTGLPACVAGVELGCGCPLCGPGDGLSEEQSARVARIRAAREKLSGLVERHAALPAQQSQEAA